MNDLLPEYHPLTEAKERVDIGVVALGPDQAILTLPDIHDEPVVVPSFRHTPEAVQILSQLREPDGKFVEVKLTNLERDRLIFCLEEQKMPGALAVTAALSPSENIYAYPRPVSEAAPTVMFPITGESGLDKSLLAALLSLQTGYPIADFESRSLFSASAYVEYLQKHVNGISDFAQARELVTRMRQETTPNRKKEVKTMGEMLDKALDYFRHNSSRPAIMICDMPGEPKAIRESSGEISGHKREFTLYEFMSRASFESPRLLSTHHMIDSQMDRKLTWVVDEVINKNLNNWRGTWQKLAEVVKGL